MVLLLCGGIALSVWPVCCLFAEGLDLFKLLSAISPGAVLLLLAFATGKIGKADGIAVLFLGLTAGGDHTWTVLSFSLLGMSLVSIGLMLLKKADRQTQMPFFPFLFCGWSLGMWLQGGFV